MSDLYLIHLEDDQTGAPIPGVDIKATSPNGNWEGLTNACGEFAPTLAPGHYDVVFTCAGYADASRSWNIGTGAVIRVGMTRVRPNRPAAVRQTPLPAFEPSDPNGIVHTTPPPDLKIPTGYDRMFWRGDFNGVTLDPSFGDPPFFNGANTTPPNMLMSPMMVLYPRVWQDRYLTAYAQRNYSHFVIAAPPMWDLTLSKRYRRAGVQSVQRISSSSVASASVSPANLVAWALYVKSWGFFVVYWGQCTTSDPFLVALLQAKAVDLFIVGEEVNSKVSPEQLDSIIRANCALTVPADVPTGVHFTSNWPNDGFPLDTYIPDWSVYKGLLSFLAWQGDQNDSAGKMGAMMWYARKRIGFNAVVVAFELLATNQLYGKATEVDGCLRSLEMLYCTSDGSAPPVAGGCNGLGRLPDGTPI